MQLESFQRYLQCPQCRSELHLEFETLVCTNSQHVYPIVDGVPELLTPKEQNRLVGYLGTADLMCQEFKSKNTVKRLTKRLIGSTLHMPINQSVENIWTSHKDELELEIGSGTQSSSANKVNLDIDRFVNVNVVASALDIPFADETFTLIRSSAVLEHVRGPNRMVEEIFRVLKPEGYVYVEVPFLQHYHAYPNDFQRYTIEGLKTLFQAFKIIEIGVCVGPSSAITALAADWFELFSFSNNRSVNNLFRLVPLILLWPVKYLDYILLKNSRAHEVASGLFILCKKPV